jgi:hypothetical protein
MIRTLELELHNKINELGEYQKEHKIKREQMEKEVNNISYRLNLLYNNIDITILDIAKKILNVSGVAYLGCGSTDSCVQDAIFDILNNFKRLRRGYFGCKNYSPWTCQRCDCDYGYGPSHGYIVFKIGMLSDARKREDFTNEEINACLYYLRNLEKIKEVDKQKSA